MNNDVTVCQLMYPLLSDDQSVNE